MTSFLLEVQNGFISRLRHTQASKMVFDARVVLRKVPVRSVETERGFQARLSSRERSTADLDERAGRDEPSVGIGE